MKRWIQQDNGMFQILVMLGILVFIGSVYYSSPLVTSYYTVASAKLPTSFNGFKIIQLSDVHNVVIGDNHKILMDKVKKQAPNLILLTGDFMDAGIGLTPESMDLVHQLVEIAPVYYSYGNHEMSLISRYSETLFEPMIQSGVTILDNESLPIVSEEGERIVLSGIRDPVNGQKGLRVGTEVEAEHLEQSLAALGDLEETSFNILLAHRPEYMEAYSQYAIDLVLSGHAHGGVVRIPLLGGLYALNQGFFPKYVEGKHRLNGTTMIISRGLGNNSLDIRVCNPPELVVVTLQTLQE